MKKAFILLLLIFQVYHSDAESGDDWVKMPQFIEPSPQAKLYMRYGEIPVDMSTGVPKIEIPIFTIETGNFSLPVNISYHASGNKVDDVASPVGLGWVLNAGGIITQTVSGVPDQINSKVEFPSAEDARALFSADKEERSPYNKSLNPKWYNLLHNDNTKLVADRYFYSFNGNIGIFRRDIQSGELKTIPHSPILIKQDNPDYFKMTDTEGNIWEFKRFEVIQENAPFPAVYEWHLEKVIVQSTGDEIRFTYIRGEKYQKGRVRKTGTWYNKPVWSFYDDVREDVCYINLNLEPTVSENYQKNLIKLVTPVLLSGIEWKDNKMTFGYKRDRKDKRLEQLDRLDNIIIKSGNTQIKTVFNNQDSYLGNSEKNYRMLLGGITVNNESYSFTYDESVILPDDFLYSRKCNEDFWGYYNGANSDNWLPFRFKNIWPCESELEYLPTREANPAYSKAGIIKEIKYPTGGKTVFEFEQNNGTNVFYNMKKDESGSSDFGGLRIKKIKNYEENTLLNSKTYEYTGGPTVTISRWHYYHEKTFLDKYHRRIELTLIKEGPRPMDCTNFYTNGIKLYSHLYKTISSSELYPISSPWGQPVLYDKITEYTGDEVNNTGKVEYYYEGTRHGAHTSYFSYHDFGNTPPLLKSKKIFKAENNGYYPVQELNNQYRQVKNDGFITGVMLEDYDKIFLFHPDDDVSNVLEPHQDHQYIKKYYYSSFKFTNVRGHIVNYALESTENIDYTSNGTVKSLTTYTYDPECRILSPIEIKTSGNDTILEKRVHPFHLTSLDIYNQMTLKNIISPVIETSFSMVRNSLEIKQKTLIQQFLNTGNKVLIDCIKLSVGNNPSEPRIHYRSYDPYGNPTCVSYEKGPPVSSLWGYKGQYPVVKIENTGYRSDVTTFSLVNEEMEYTLNHKGGPVSLQLIGVAPVIAINNQLEFRLTRTDNGEVIRSHSDSFFKNDKLVTYDLDLPAGNYLIYCSISRGCDIHITYQGTENGVFYEGFEEYNGAITGKAAAGERYHATGYTVPYTKPENRDYVVDYRYREGGTWKYKRTNYVNNMRLTDGDAIDEVRVYPVNALMTTYTYKPLVGMSSETDPSGRTIFYEYDDYGRLKYIRNEHHFILKEHHYHYQQ